jgi:death-on-curing protein
MGITFLTLVQVLAIHEDQIARYGGDATVRDAALLQSAVAMPQAGFAAQHLHAFPHEMAAAYLYHIAQNHPFVDGNKRTGLATALMFLELNDCRFNAPKQDVENLVLAVAQGKLEKSAVAEFFRDHVDD